ncbi:hypothetical protein [Segatella bryantii]|uniref:hypothetical protein n=1 Tax=Segatella bryantii TaxID=77095 RepID=UPI002430186D|nr:hypothetical protein [Segatella bryantii]
MERASELLMNTALAIIATNYLSKKELNNLEQIHVTETHADPDGAWIRVEPIFKNGDTGALDIGIEEFDDIPFAKLFNEVLKNEKRLNATKWIESGMHDVTDVPIIYCEKCKFPTIHRFDYCPNCGRKIIN